MLFVPRAILFDLDGTLVDSRSDIASAANHALVAAGQAPMSTDALSALVGDGARSLLARALMLPSNAPELDTHLQRWRSFYLAHPADRTTWMPGAQEAIVALRARGILLATVTNKDRTVTETILSALGVRHQFAAVWGAGDGALKRAPDGLFATMKALGCAPRETWMVGDGAQDVGAARAAGCVAIAVLGGFHPEARLREAHPDALIASMRELVPLVDGASKGNA